MSLPFRYVIANPYCYCCVFDFQQYRCSRRLPMLHETPVWEENMKRAYVLLMVLFMGCATAIAQAENPYNGDWTASWQSSKGALHYNNVGKVTILDNGGTFQNLRSSTRNPCVGKKAPISVKTVTADELIFVIEFSSVLKGCSDSEVKLKRVDDKTLKGMRDLNKEITLVRD